MPDKDGLAEGWIQYTCKECGAVSSALKDSLCGRHQVCETCARKKPLEELEFWLKKRGVYPFITYRGGAMKAVINIEVKADEVAAYYGVNELDVGGKKYLHVLAAEDIEVGPVTGEQIQKCTPENPCCERQGEYNGFASGPLKFVCPKHCRCHD